MTNAMWRFSMNLVPLLLLGGAGCSGGPAGKQGAIGHDGLVTLVRTGPEAAPGECGELQGVRIEAGVDGDGDGVLADNEVTAVAYVCDGPQGPTGAKGETGAMGVQGLQGEPGEKGAPGTQGEAGLACWDLDANSAFNVATEDQDGDGVASAADCRGPAGPGPDLGSFYTIEDVDAALDGQATNAARAAASAVAAARCDRLDTGAIDVAMVRVGSNGHLECPAGSSRCCLTAFYVYHSEAGVVNEIMAVASNTERPARCALDMSPTPTKTGFACCARSTDCTSFYQ